MANSNTVIAQLNGSGDRRAQLIASQTITIVAALIAVLLRFISRYIKKTAFGFDDWLVVPSLVCALGVYAICWWMISMGLGQFDGKVTLDKLRTPNLGTWINQILYAVVLSTVNISVLALYWRVFCWKCARACCVIIGILRLVWMVVTIALVCLLCQPIESAWNSQVAAEACPIDQLRYYMWTGISTMILDFVTVGLAMTLSFRLQMGRLDRFLLCIVFASGFFVTAATGVRIKAMMDLDRTPLGLLNPNWTYTSVALWKGVEINLAVVSACLPCLKPLVNLATQTCLGFRPAKESQYTDMTSPRSTRPRKRTSGPGIGGVPGAWFRVSRLSTLDMNGVEFGDSKKPQSVHTRHGASEINLPIQDLEGKEIPAMPAATMDRPPSWAASLPIWDGSSGRSRTYNETGRPMSNVPEGMKMRSSVEIESGRESPWPLKD